MARPLSPKDKPGSIYILKLAGTPALRLFVLIRLTAEGDEESCATYKVVRSINVQRRVEQWARQCPSKAPVLVDSFEVQFSHQIGEPSSMVLFKGSLVTQRLEYLAHIELEYVCKDRPSSVCSECGRCHREIFRFDVSTCGRFAAESVITNIVKSLRDSWSA